MIHKPLLEAVLGKHQNRPPVWIMRQAGRYLPEYRELRSKAKNFLDLCYNPDLATEISLQPVYRFDFDAAILFSDILVIPDALGQKIHFEQGEGPILDPINASTLCNLRPERVLEHLAPVFETVACLHNILPSEKTLIGFCGSPWTVATYMIGGRGSSDQAAARLFSFIQPDAFTVLMDILIDVSIAYLVAQFKAGVDVVQLFESWAFNLDDENFIHNVIEPNRRIVAGVREHIPDAPFIGFPRGAAGNLVGYAAATGVNVLGLDYATPIDFVAKFLPNSLPVQGNLDPLRLLAGGRVLDERIDAIIGAFADRPHIFNLGHGILPETPVAHVTRLVERVRKG